MFETHPTTEEDAALDAYKSACQRLKRYFAPKTNKVYERYRFNEMTPGDELMELESLPTDLRTYDKKMCNLPENWSFRQEVL